MDQALLISVNEGLNNPFCESDLDQKEQNLVDLWYSGYIDIPCNVLQVMYFILEYRASFDVCSTYNKVILDKLVENSGCSLEPVPEFTTGDQYFIIGKV